MCAARACARDSASTFAKRSFTSAISRVHGNNVSHDGAEERGWGPPRLIMSSLLIEGGHRLSGRITVEGNKNAALPLLAACLLTSEECLLTNMPRISDVEVMALLLADLGADVQGI